MNLAAMSSRFEATGAGEYPRRVLLAAAGLSPQVVTETIYALAVARTSPWCPTEVRLVATEEGWQRARLALLSEEPGWLHRLRAEYSLPPVRLDEGTVTVLENDGMRLADIRTEADATAAADRITNLVRELTSDPQCALHVSLAGGRKTMGFYLGTALSLYGRAQDRLSHVLVTPPYESNPGFYYPSRHSRVIYTPPPENRPLDTAAATITLAEVPFVRLRGMLSETVIARQTDFSAAIAEAQQRLDPPEVVIYAEEGYLTAGGIEVRLRPSEMAFYAMLARRVLRGEGPVACPPDGAPEVGLARAYLEEYQRTNAAGGMKHRVGDALRNGMEKSFFLERKSRLKRALEDALGARSAGVGLAAIGQRPETKWALAVEADRIRMED